MSSIGSKLTSNLCRGSCGRKSKNAERTAQQENEDEIIARVIEERIEGTAHSALTSRYMFTNLLLFDHLKRS